MHGAAVGDVVLCLQTRDDRQDRAKRADHQRPEAHLPEVGRRVSVPTRSKSTAAEEQGGRKVVEQCVQAGPVVAEHQSGVSER